VLSIVCRRRPEPNLVCCPPKMPRVTSPKSCSVFRCGSV